MRIDTLNYVKRRGAQEFEIVFEDGSALTIDAELVVRFHLKAGGDVPDDEVVRLRCEQSRLVARRRLVSYLSLRRKSRAEARRYLEQMKLDDDAVTYALEAAQELGLLDDEGYAAAYVRTQERSARKGPRAIRQELLARGVQKDVVDESLSQSADPGTQRERARGLAEKKAAQLRAANRGNPRAALAKLASFLLRKGYDPDIAAETARDVLGGADDLTDGS